MPRLDLDPYDDAALTPGGFGEQVFAAEQAGEIPPGTAGTVIRTLERLPLRVSLN